MSVHNGKIGRLPRELRDEVNQRLENGEQAGAILKWLNGLPAVRDILATEFGGQRINGQNLSNWRTGGYQDWQQQRERRISAKEFAEQAAELKGEDGKVADLAKNLSFYLTADLAVTARKLLGSVTDPAERCRLMHGLLGTLMKIRREDIHADRQQLEQDRLDFKRVKAGLAQDPDEANRGSAAPVGPVPREEMPEAVLLTSAAASQRNLGEDSKVVGLDPDIPGFGERLEDWSSQNNGSQRKPTGIKVNQGESR